MAQVTGVPIAGRPTTGTDPGVWEVSLLKMVSPWSHVGLDKGCPGGRALDFGYWAVRAIGLQCYPNDKTVHF